jgi:uncharacterized YigZ family protein
MSLVAPNQTQIHTFKELQSKFISIIRPFDEVSNFKSWLGEIRKEYYDASHVCWGYRIQDHVQLEENSSDAGEPSGTAGLPILNAMKRHKLVNCGVLVIRYFGGTKLGKRGLIDAYSKSANEVIKTITCTPWEKMDQFTILSPMCYYGELSQSIMKIGGKIIENKSGELINWIVEINAGKLNELIQIIRSVTKGEGELQKIKKGADSVKPRRK